MDQFLTYVQNQLQLGSYDPLPVQRVYIPKGNGSELRPLGIPAVIDRVVQAAVKIVIEPIFEADFLGTSWGFRPKRNAHDALEMIRRQTNRGSTWVLDADIRKYFDNINHEKLLILVKQRIIDRRILWLIKRWLKSGVMEAGQIRETQTGTPQGGVISPLLANIYLHLMDRIWSKHYGHLGVLIRYADDFVVLCRSEKAVHQAREKLEQILKRLDLSLHPEKTQLVNLEAPQARVKFLGFEMIREMSLKRRDRKFTLRIASKQAMQKMRTRVRQITEYGPNLQRDTPELILQLNQYLRGWGGYFRKGNTSEQLKKVDRYVRFRLTLWMARKHHWPKWRRRQEFTVEQLRKMGLVQLHGTVEWYKSKWVC